MKRKRKPECADERPRLRVSDVLFALLLLATAAFFVWGTCCYGEVTHGQSTRVPE